MIWQQANILCILNMQPSYSMQLPLQNVFNDIGWQWHDLVTKFMLIVINYLHCSWKHWSKAKNYPQLKLKWMFHWGIYPTTHVTAACPTTQWWSALKPHNLHNYVREMRPLQMSVSGLWRGAGSTEADRWVTATWELPLTAHLDGLFIRKRAKKIKSRQFSPPSPLSFFSPPTRHITLEHHRLYSRQDFFNLFIF